MTTPRPPSNPWTAHLAAARARDEDQVQDELRTVRAERDEARDDYRLLKRDVEELLRRLPVELDARAANARLAVIASLHIVR